jgi:hypothetical protein
MYNERTGVMLLDSLAVEATNDHASLIQHVCLAWIVFSVMRLPRCHFSYSLGVVHRRKY